MFLWDKQGNVYELKPEGEDKEKSIKKGADEARHGWLITPSGKLKLNAEYNIKVKPGILSAFGPEKGIEDELLRRFTPTPGLSSLALAVHPSKVTDTEALR